ncbi:hypothetical protein ILUMI_27106 [Ignelater luminosus]|uniref:Epoxide hydrolase n=1 Tax=Ignelater luminosus TaxID=2038154 RepID=A0A8K0C5L4_IGNLU|nr:hypothetical protein ILUMI_27106 [Ignelater luminosus]
MSLLRTLLLLSTVVLIVLIGIKINSLIQPPPVPKIEENRYWGPGNRPSKEDTTIKSFKISVSEEILTDLKTRLETTRTLTPPLEGIQQQYGFNTNLLQKVINYWKKDYDWRKRETFLNQFPQYKTRIQGLNLHYIHVKPKNVRTLPLLLLHGWPGSVREFYKIIPILTKPQQGQDFAFEVIVPSLPGYGFSEGSSKPGFGSIEIAMVLKNLMKRIGHDKFYVQGGDWGAILVANMAALFPENILGLHSNMCSSISFISNLKVALGSIYPPLIIDKRYEHQMYPFSEKLQKGLEESGYFHIQATKPDTIGVAIGQSPAGLAAYILEKFSTGTNYTYKAREDGGLLEKFTYDELIDNLMLYWVTNSFTTSARIYAESFTKAQLAHRVMEIPIKENVPCACARFAHEIIYNTDWILRDKFTNLIQTTDFDKGGHFAALEEPQLLAQDIVSAVRKMERWRNGKKE